MKFHRTFIYQIFILIYFTFVGFNSTAQFPDLSDSDSIRLLPIQLTEIPLRSAETFSRTRKILDNLITKEEITELKLINDSILNLVEKENADFFQNRIESQSIRYLKNRALQLKNRQNNVDVEMNHLTGIISDLDKSIEFLSSEKEVWSKTREVMSKSSYSESIIKQIDLITGTLDDAVASVSGQVEDMLSTIGRSSELSIEMDVQLTDLNTAIRISEEQLILDDHPSILRLDYSKENLRFAGAFNSYFASEWLELKTYLKDQVYEFVLTLILFALLLYLFLNYKRIFIGYREDTDNYYKKKIGVILSQPISTAIVLTILATILIFPNRPPSFRDFTIYLIVIPLVIIMRKLLYKKLLFIVYGFAVIMMLNIIYVMLPPENIIFRFSLIFIAITEIYFIWYFLFKTLPKLSYSNINKLVFKTIAYTFLLIASIGLFGSIYGNVMLAQLVLSSVNITIIASSILYASVITIIGLLISLLDGKTVLKFNIFKNYRELIKQKVIKLLHFGTAFYAFAIFLKSLNLWEVLKEGVLEFFLHEWSIGEIGFSLGTILIFILVIYLSISIGKFIQIILEDDILDKIPLSKGMPHTISVMVRYTFITVGIFFAIGIIGMDLSSMTVIIGAFSVGIGFGLQNIFNNLVSGFILLFERPVKIGDTIEVGALIGKVSSIGIRASNIKTFDGAEVIVPNGQLISNEVINWTLSDQQRRVEIVIGVSYNSDPHAVYNLLIRILKEHKEIFENPKPIVLFSELGESSLDFRLLFWTSSDKWLQIRSEIIFNTFDLLKENNIEIPFPQRDLHIKNFEQQLKIDTSVNNKLKDV